MSVPDLEARLRQLRLTEPPADLGGRVLETARTLRHLGRHLRVAWGAAAAAALLVVAIHRAEPARMRIPTPMPELPEEMAGIEMPFMRLAMAEPKVDVWKAARRYADALKGEYP